jgi:hypothetical protein
MQPWLKTLAVLEKVETLNYYLAFILLNIHQKEIKTYICRKSHTQMLREES